MWCARCPSQTSEDAAQAFNLLRVEKLLTSKHTKKDRERHVAALQRLSKAYSSFELDDFPTLCRVVELCIEKYAGGLNPSYLDALGDGLEPLGQPYRKAQGVSASDEEERVVGLLNALAKALDVDAPAFQNVIVSMLLKVRASLLRPPAAQTRGVSPARVL